jgi:hypothetical protein
MSQSVLVVLFPRGFGGPGEVALSFLCLGE